MAVAAALAVVSAEDLVEEALAEVAQEEAGKRSDYIKHSNSFAKEDHLRLYYSNSSSLTVSSCKQKP
ncbi:hypothetical protein GCM10007383_34410 [Arenibacter certesii]|uniref:Uncharacterized protein n=1 Tax=Arenibacter certesii TaxID=228955 RepID=A0A918J6N9_9FLAO|nr:hypothetical protein GCM10007383_34410 [Arenibacter certesii]